MSMTVQMKRAVLSANAGPDNAAEMADNTLDLMVGRELKGDDYMSVGEMRDELYQCEPLTALSPPRDGMLIEIG